MAYHFPRITLLVTHYNRSRSLERLLNAFENQNCFFGEVIISDDGSKPEHLGVVKNLQAKFNFKLVTTMKNKGLGNNINKGQDAVTMPYTLYIQEDFTPIPGFAPHLQDAFKIMEVNNELDIVRFYAYFIYPFLKPYEKGFSEMIFSPWTMSHLKFYYYSDHPHLRRSSFFNKFGRYAEGLDINLTEYKMAISFLKNKGKGLFYNQFNTLFNQINSFEEPSTLDRRSWKQGKNFFTIVLRAIYLKFRLLKGHLDLILTK